MEVTRMIDQPTVIKLKEMRLKAMADAFENQLSDKSYDHLSFEERMGILVDCEWSRRRSNKLQRLIQTANFRYPNACVEAIEYHLDRRLNKSQILRLSTCSFVREGHHVILKGATGCGKSFLACALGIAACRQFMSVKYIQLSELLDEVAIAKGEGTLDKLKRRYLKIDLLIIDEWLLLPLSASQSILLFDVIETRTKRGAMIFCTQYDTVGWYQRLAKCNDSALTEAIMDRIQHNNYEIQIHGDISMRERHGLKRNLNCNK
jgi:DNA replication protein DnaC